MIEYKIKNRLNPPALSDAKLGGMIAEQMATFFEERILCDFARDHVYAECEEKFRLRDDDKECIGMWRGEFWGKWVISACRVARYLQNDELKDFLHTAALNLIATADDDGYIGTYKYPENVFPCDPEVALRTLGRSSNWNWNLWCRKYTLWGLLECYELTGDEVILNACVKATDQYISMLERLGVLTRRCGTFNGLAAGSILKPMLILYRLTGDEKYFDFANTIALDWDRRDGGVPNLIANSLAMKPVHEWYENSQKWAKAYEMMSCFDGIIELYRVTGEEKLLTAAKNYVDLLWEHEQNVLFSVGFNDIFLNASRWINALSEPCDVIHWMRINSELYRLTGDVKYMDRFERAFYNPFLSAVFADGKWGARCVRSWGRPLVATGQASMNYSHCCVNNMPRGFMNAVESFVLTEGNTIHVNLYTDFEADLTLADGKAHVSIGGSYLADGQAAVTVTTDCEAEVCLRLPGWSKTTVINEKPFSAPSTTVTLPASFGTTVYTLRFDMTPVIRDFEGEVEVFPKSDVRCGRYIGGNDVPEEYMVKENRSTILYGALLLTRSKLVGNTEDEMFRSPTICGKGCACTVTPIDPAEVRTVPTVRNAFRVKFTNGTDSFETVMCDYATGSNHWSKDDPLLYSVFM